MCALTRRRNAARARRVSVVARATHSPARLEDVSRRYTLLSFHWTSGVHLLAWPRPPPTRIVIKTCLACPPGGLFKPVPGRYRCIPTPCPTDGICSLKRQLCGHLKLGENSTGVGEAPPIQASRHRPHYRYFCGDSVCRCRLTADDRRSLTETLAIEVKRRQRI